MILWKATWRLESPCMALLGESWSQLGLQTGVLPEAPGESGATGGEAGTKRALSKCHLSLLCTQKVVSVLYQSPHLIITSSGREVLFLAEDIPSWRADPSAISSSSHLWHLLSAFWVTELRILPSFSQQSYQLSTITIPIFGLELEAWKS